MRGHHAIPERWPSLEKNRCGPGSENRNRRKEDLQKAGWPHSGVWTRAVSRFWEVQWGVSALRDSEWEMLAVENCSLRPREW